MNGERFVELRKDEHCPSFGFNIKGGYDAGCPVYVWRVEPGSLADRYGLKSGDEILQANGIDFTRIEHSEALKLLKGQNVLCLYLRSPHPGAVLPGTPLLSQGSSSHPPPLIPPPSGVTTSISHLHHQQSHLLDYPLIPTNSIEEDELIYSNAEFYTWVDRLGAPVSPPRINESWPKRNVDIEIQPGQNLGLMIRGGSEYGLGIYVTGVDPGSVAERAGLQRGDEIIEVNGRPFTSITHDKAVAILKASRKMNMLVSFIGKIPADLTFEPRVKLVEDDIDKCTNILAMIEEKARTVLTKSEHSRFTFYREEYQQGFLPVHTFVRILLELLSTHEKYTLLTEVREIIRPADRSIFDELIYKPVHSTNYGPSHIDDHVLHMDSKRSPGGVHHHNGTATHLNPEMGLFRDFTNSKHDPQMCRTSPGGTTQMTHPGPSVHDTGIGTNGKMMSCQPLHANTPAVRYRVRIQKTKPILGIAIEGGVNTPHRLPRIININADGSAYNSNLKPGQVLLSVDGKKLDGQPHEEIARLITESYSDTTKTLIEFVVVEAKSTNNTHPQRQQSSSSHHQSHQQPQQQQPSSLVLCGNN